MALKRLKTSEGVGGEVLNTVSVRGGSNLRSNCLSFHIPFLA